MPPRRLILDPSYSAPVSTWSVAAVRAALDDLERGKMRNPSLLADAVERDPVIASALSTRVRMLVSKSALPFDLLDSEEGDGRKLRSVAARQRELWWSMLPESAMAPLLRNAIMLGVAVGYVEWATEGGEWIPRLRWLPPHNLEWHATSDQGKADPHYTYSTATGERMRVTPGDGSWFLHEPNGERSYMQGALRSLAMLYRMRLDAYRDWIRYAEKHGLPILGVSEPHWASDDVEGSSSTQADEFYAQFGDLGSESVLRLPQGPTPDDGKWEAGWIEPTSDAWQTFREALRELGADIDRVLLGRDQNAGARGGDGELSSERVRVEYLSSDTEPLATSIREQVLKPWAAFQWGDARLAGWPRWDTRPPPDLERRARTLDLIGDALGKLSLLGVELGPVMAEFGLRQGEKPVPVAPQEPQTTPESDPEQEDDGQEDEDGED